MIKVELLIDDGREEVTVVTAIAAPEPAPAKPRRSLWELLHQSFAARLHEEERES